MNSKIKEIAKKGVLAGLGLAVVTKEKAEAIAKFLIKKGNASKKDAKKIAKIIMEDAQKGKKIIEDRVKPILHEISKKFDLPTRKEFEALKRTVSELKKKKK